MLQFRSRRFTTSALLGDNRDAEAGESGHRLYEHLVSEVQACGVGVAVITTAVNALNDWRVAVCPADIARFAPDSAALRALLPVLDTHHVLDARLGADLRTYSAELDVARRALDGFLNDCEALSPARAGLLHARFLQDGWRALAGESRALIIDIQRAAPAHLPELHSQNTRILSALLSGAANGLKPCLDEGGRLYLPPLPQRRRSPRRAVLQNCTVSGPTDVQRAFIRDASAGGLGLGRVSGLNRGDRIRVDCSNGRQFHGTVAWVKGSSVGMRFDVPLQPNDSLLSL